MIRHARPGPILLALATALSTGAVTAAPMTDGFDLGRGKDGEFCEARRAANDPAVPGLFNANYTVRCRGWTETLWIGQLFAYQDAKSAETLTRSAEARLECGPAGPIAVAGLTNVTGRRCRDRDSGRNAVVISAGRGKSRQAAIGLEAFAGNLAGGMRNIAGNPADTALSVDLAALAPPPPAPRGKARRPSPPPDSIARTSVPTAPAANSATHGNSPTPTSRNSPPTPAPPTRSTCDSMRRSANRTSPTATPRHCSSPTQRPCSPRRTPRKGRPASC